MWKIQVQKDRADLETQVCSPILEAMLRVGMGPFVILPGQLG